VRDKAKIAQIYYTKQTLLYIRWR